MVTRSDILAITYRVSQLPDSDAATTLPIGQTIPAEFFEVIQTAFLLHTQSIDKQLSNKNISTTKRYQLLAYRGFNYQEFLTLWDKSIPVENTKLHPIFEVLMLATQAQRKAFISSYQPDEISYIQALIQLHSPIIPLFFYPLPARLLVGNLMKHTYISGQSGSGKSEIMKLIWYGLQTKSSGKENGKYSLVFIDPHGDISRELLALHLNLEEKERLIFFDPFLSNDKFPVLNPLETNNKSLSFVDTLAQSISSALQELWPSAEMTLQMQTLLIPCIATLLLDENRSLKDLQNFMQNDPALLALGKQSPFPAHRQFFETAFLNKSYEHTKAGIYTRIQSLLNNAGFYRATTGRSTVHLEKAINEGKIIIVRFTKDKGEEASRAFNKLLIARLQSIVLSRSDQVKEQRKSCFLFIDEFQNYLSPSIGLILEESRKFGLHLVIANQNLGQISDTRLLRTILSNTFTKIVGANGFKDLKDFSAEIGVKVTQLQQLPPYKFYCKSGTNPAFVFDPAAFLVGHQPPFFLDKKQTTQLKEYLVHQSGQYQKQEEVERSKAAAPNTPPKKKLEPKYKF
ncbi:Type IV secretion-system coupling protein DNA-binding domain-containing protein [Flexibacter flexilis DSM 6793]|uniref:Type IV secretion-system coupling protein DNA-binding domain-containing protein n=1 Tax=Flexibacter flexilis DSM 6793 TaxID=927664 RepID=A0A1I1NK93_9BACT|nr:DUF87 domain-containing protein [Flexibacter flexilis]SFC94140.1 Type IV secretion-system coupling protein DNA-binding domain-containing protein [Flexibacter flexilis DSM 6793]